MRLNAGKTLTGVDIEPGYVAAVQARPGGVSVERAAGSALADGIVREGEVADVDGLAETLKELFAQHKLPKNVRVGLANQRIVVRTIDLPPISDAKQLASVVRFQAQDHIPMPLDQAVLEHHSLGIVQTPDGDRTRVVLVAARRDMVSRLVEALRRAGLRPQGLDLSAFAMVRALYRPDRPNPVLYVSIGGMTNLAVAEGTTCVFTRTLSLGTEALAGELAERQGLTLEHAHGWLRHVGLLVPLEQVEGDEAVISAARDVLSDGVSRLADEVRTTLDFHQGQSSSDLVQAAVLTGSAAALTGFAETLGREVGLPIEVGTVTEARAGAFDGVDPERLTVAAGLTIEEVAA
jgi:type IV pilus assembly protein PilM